MNQQNKRPDKPQAMVSRQQIILGTLTLLGMAVLMIVGLTPRSASAPEAEPDTAQVAQDAVQSLDAACEMIQHLTYTPCQHQLTRRQALPPDLAGKTRADLEAAYDAWQITSFAPKQITMSQSLDMYCPQHFILMPDDSGMLCIFQNKYGDALALVEELGVLFSELPDSYQEELRGGLGFDSQEELVQWLEVADS